MIQFKLDFFLKKSRFETILIISISEVYDMANNPKVTDFLKECIADAIIKLLEKKPLEKITIPEIAEISGVSRATYFRYFKNKTDPLVFKLNKLWMRWAEEHNVLIRNKFDKNNAKTYFEYHQSIQGISSLLYSRNLETVFYESIHKIMYPESGDNVFECYQNSFYSYALFGLVNEWIKRGYCETPDDMLIYVKKIVENPLK